VETTWLGLPKGHIGLMPGGNDGFALTAQLVGRYRLSSVFAIDAGVGLPHGAMGAAGWVTFEVFERALGSEERGWGLRAFQQAGPQLGYAGADYFARHNDSFVGYGYTAAGPLAFALRFPIGVCLDWPGGFLDTYLEAVPILALTPEVEMLYDVAFGTRVRF